MVGAMDLDTAIWQNHLRSSLRHRLHEAQTLLSWLKRVFGAKPAEESAEPIPRYIDEKRAKAIKQAALFEESLGARGAPQCPRCGAEMTLELAPSGSRFWGCTEYPACKATRKA